MKHYHYGSTPNFSNLYGEVQRLASNQRDRCAAAGFDPDGGAAPTAEQIELMKAYSIENTVMPTIQFEGSEKLHGENMAVCQSSENMWVQGRNHIRTLEQDQNGMALFVAEREEVFTNLFKWLRDDYGILPTSTIVLDGEWAGGNIQSGNAAVSGTPKAFFLFDYFRVIDEDEDIDYLSTLCLDDRDNGIYRLKDYSTFVLRVDFSDPEKAQKDLDALALSVEANSPVAKAFDKPDNVGEGVYLTGTYKGRTLRLKAKGEKHGGKPKEKRVPKQVLSDDDVVKATALADKLTPVWRLTQAITETNATEMKQVGEVIKWVSKDILKEEEPELIKAGIEWKYLQRYIVQEIKDYYLDYISPAGRKRKAKLIKQEANLAQLEELIKLMETTLAEVADYKEKPNKSKSGRLRVAFGAIKNSITDVRRELIAADKAGY